MEISEVYKFTFLEFIETVRVSRNDILKRIGKTQHALNLLKWIWNNGEISQSPKIRIFNVCVGTILNTKK